jgi:hypothetical protein
MGHSSLSIGAAGSVLAAFMLQACLPAHADGAMPAATGTAASIDQAIEHEKSVRSGAITGMVLGGIVIVGGSVQSAIASAENTNNRNDGNPARNNVYVGYAVGLAVGLPIMGLSAWLFSDAQHKLNRLKQQRFSVSYSPDTHQPVLQLTLNY